MDSICNVVRWIKSSFTNENIKEESNVVECLPFPSQDLEMFINLLNDDTVLKDFLDFDKCNVLADKYLLAITFVYFVRAGYTYSQYNRQNFFSALYLAHEMEEDDESLKELLIPWCNGINRADKQHRLIRGEMNLWHAINFRSLVSKIACEEVISYNPDAQIWRRFRPECHSGAYRESALCSKCFLHMSPDDRFLGFIFEDDFYEGQPSKRARLMESTAESSGTYNSSNSDVNDLSDTDINNNNSFSNFRLDDEKLNEIITKEIEE